MLGHAQVAAYFLTAAQTFYPESNHLYMEKPAITEARYQEFADQVASFVLDSRVKPLFAGEGGYLKTGLLLMSIARFESSYRNDVMTCSKIGDQGVSFGPFQTSRDPDTVCQSFFQASWVAVEMIRESFQVCKMLPMEDRLAEYTDGNNWMTHKAWKRSEDRMNTAIHFWNATKVALKTQELTRQTGKKPSN